MGRARGRAAAAAAGMSCGAGGPTYGLRRAGIRAYAEIGADPSCGYPFKASIGAPFCGTDAGGVPVRIPRSFHPFRFAKMPAGCAPCRPFSCRSRRKKRGLAAGARIAGH